MSLSTELISQFVKATKVNKKEEPTKTLSGVTVVVDGVTYVKLDGSELLTPVVTTVDTKPDERVNVTIENHTATIVGNKTSPAARKDDVDDVADQISEFEIVMAYKVTATDLEAVNATINTLLAKVAKFSDVTAVTAEIESLRAKYAELDTISAKDIEALNADIENIQAQFGDFTGITAEDLEALNADIANLKGYNAEFTYVSAERLTAINAEIKDLDAKKLSAEQAELTFANIDFTNIGTAAIEEFFSKSGMITDLVVGEGTITGKLVGVTITGDLIQGNTVTADKLVVLGEDGIYYKLNINALGETTVNGMTEEEQTELQNGLHGSNIIAKTITAEKIKVDDLVAFGADIGGFHITEDAIYSGAKSSATNTTRGIYQDNEGQFSVGDSDNYLRYYKDDNGVYRLEVVASAIRLGTSNKTIDEELEDIRNEMTVNLRIESSRGTVFKNDNVATVLSAVIYRGSQRITDISALRAAMGATAYLQWKWQRLDETSFGVISASDSRIGNDGFTFTLSPTDVNTKVTFMCELIV